MEVFFRLVWEGNSFRNPLRSKTARLLDLEEKMVFRFIMTVLKGFEASFSVFSIGSGVKSQNDSTSKGRLIFFRRGFPGLKKT